MSGLSLFHEGFVKVDGSQLFYRVNYPHDHTNDSPLVVFLHEGLGCTAMWKDFPAKVSEAAGAIALVYDRLGYGKSDPVVKPRKPDFLRHEADVVLPRLLDVLGIDRPVCLFGHSDGASIALLAASLHPGRVKAVVAEAPHVVIEEVTINGVKSVQNLWKNGDLGDSLRKYHAENTEKMIASWLEVWLQPAAAEWKIIEDLQSVQSPVLFIQGMEDNFGTLLQMEIIRRSIKGPFEHLVIPGCGHSPHFQALETVLSQAVAFIGQYGK